MRFGQSNLAWGFPLNFHRTRIMDFKWFTTSLNPAFSPRRRRIVRRLFENSRDWICQMISREPKTAIAVPSPGGEGQVEGGRKIQISFNPGVHPKIISGNKFPSFPL